RRHTRFSRDWSSDVCSSDLDTFYNRESLIKYATNTVLGNMFEGMLFVMFIVLIFMADWRTTVIVAIIIPLSLLFAFICLTLRGKIGRASCRERVASASVCWV